jgi:hypothetical protein
MSSKERKGVGRKMVEREREREGGREGEGWVGGGVL